jgi:GT2 family glycosyltransferase
VAITGYLALDGAGYDRELSHREMRATLAASHSLSLEGSARTENLYGCNMAVRFDAFERTKFDERLPLYSLYEDLDLGRRLLRIGTISLVSACVGAHRARHSGGALSIFASDTPKSATQPIFG